MSAINGDKARFNRQRKHKLAKRERYRLLREKLAGTAPSGRQAATSRTLRFVYATRNQRRFAARVLSVHYSKPARISP
jgi:hypothetical protein